MNDDTNVLIFENRTVPLLSWPYSAVIHHLLQLLRNYRHTERNLKHSGMASVYPIEENPKGDFNVILKYMLSWAELIHSRSSNRSLRVFKMICWIRLKIKILSLINSWFHVRNIFCITQTRFDKISKWFTIKNRAVKLQS